MRPYTAQIALALCLAGLVGWGYAPATYDDGYITLRYADNLARGRGFVFNPGEPVLGTSAPGYGLLLAGLQRTLPLPGVDVALWGVTLGLLALAALPLLLLAIRRHDPGRERPEIAVFIFALLAIPCRWNVEMLGGEGLLVLALVAAAFASALAGHERWAGLLAGLATALRFDALLAVAAIGTALWLDRRRPPWRFAALVAPAPLAVALWLFATFGSALPSTLAGKRSEMPFAARGYAASELDWLVRTFGPAGAFALALLALGGILAIARLPSRYRVWAGAFASWLIANEAFYRLAAVPFAPWYHLAAVNGLLALAAVGCGSWLSAAGNARTTVARWVEPALAVAGLLAVFLPMATFHASTWGRPPDPRIRVYRDLALALRARTDASAHVGAVEIGALAYFGDRPVVDLTGLVDPEVLAARRADRLAEFVATDPPEFLVDNPNFRGSFLAPLVESGRIDRDYRVVETFRRPEYPFEVRLLERRTAPLR